MSNPEPIRILYIGSDPEEGRLVGDTLERAGYAVDLAEAQGVKLAGVDLHRYDLVAVDEPSDAEDPQVLRLLAARGPLPPTIVIIGSGDEPVAAEALALGSSDFVVRDARGRFVHLLPLVIERALAQQRLAEEKDQALGSLRRQAQEQAALHDITSAIAASLDPEELLSTVLEMVLSIIGSDAGWVVLPGPTLSDHPRVAASHGVPEALVEAETASPLDDCPMCAALLEGSDRQPAMTRVADCPRIPHEVMAQANIDAHVCVPLAAGDEVLGLLDLAWPGTRTCLESDRTLLRAIGQQVGVALKNAQLYQAARQVNRLQLLNAISAAASASLELDVVLRQVLELTCEALGADEGSILLNDAETGGLFFAVTLGERASSLPGRRLAPGQGIAGWVAQHGRPARVSDAQQDARFYAGVDAHTGVKTRSLLCAPLTHFGKTLGAIEVVDKRRDLFTEEDASLLESVASIAAVALENARLYETTRARADELALVNEVGLALTATLDYATVIHAALSQIRRLLGADHVALLRRDLHTDVLHFAHMLVGHTMVDVSLRIQPGQGLLGWVSDKRQPVLVADMPADPRFSPLVAQELGKQAPGSDQMRSMIAVPLLTPKRTIGVVSAVSRQPGVYSRHDLNTLQAIASTLGVAMENARLYEAEQAAQQQLRDLAGYLQAAREEERTHIAREVHDELGQMLTALKIDLSWLAKRLPPDDAGLWSKVDTMSALIDDTIATVRHIATELRPGLLDDLGLVAALEWQAQEFTVRTGIQCELRLGDQDIPLERDLATALFRISQEALTNVARHADATQVLVELENSPHGLVLIVQDNGKGMAESQIHASRSLGLMGMRERARAFDGDIAFETAQDRGTKVIIRIPRDRGRQEGS